MINLASVGKSLKKGFINYPFDHMVIDDFLDDDTIDKIVGDFPVYSSSDWHVYDNGIEHKRTINAWHLMPKSTYALFQYLNSSDFVDSLCSLVGKKLYADSGLHGGGWHCHGTGGNLNPHLDYSIHPKLGLQRFLNIIIYVSPNLHEVHRGHLGLWEHDPHSNGPGKLAKEIAPKFNRAVIFNTTQNSWHGMSQKLIVPDDVFRQSLAIYYLCDPMEDAVPRDKALFAARSDQVGKKDIEKLIKARSSSETASEVYIKK